MRLDTSTNRAREAERLWTLVEHIHPAVHVPPPQRLAWMRAGVPGMPASFHRRLKRLLAAEAEEQARRELQQRRRLPLDALQLSEAAHAIRDALASAGSVA